MVTLRHPVPPTSTMTAMMQEQEVDAFKRQVVIHQPGIHDGGERQEDEPEDRNQQIVVGALQIGGEQEHEHQHDAREGQQDNNENAGHRPSIVAIGKRICREDLNRTKRRIDHVRAERTVLIVDDDPQILRLVQRMLGGRAVKVLMAPRPSEALQNLRS